MLLPKFIPFNKSKQITINNEGMISNRIYQKPLNKNRVPLALQDGYALQSENDNPAPAQPAAPSFLEVYKKKLNAISHLTRYYAQINIVSCFYKFIISTLI